MASQWTLIDVGNGQFKLRSIATNRYLDGDRSDIDTTSNASANGTNWRFIDGGDGYYYLYNIRYNDYIDARGASADVDWDPGALDPDDLWRVTLI